MAWSFFLHAGLLSGQAGGNPGRQPQTDANFGRQILVCNPRRDKVPDSRLHTGTPSTILDRV